MTSSPRFAINGYAGRMGQAVAKILHENGLGFVARFEKDDPIELGDVDIVIDFTTPQSSVAMARACVVEAKRRRTPLAHIIGSTGFTDEQEGQLSLCAKDIIIVKSGNFSIGVNVLIGMVSKAAAQLNANEWDIDISEAHHRRKIDAPSGTALMLGEAAANGRGSDLKAVKSKPYDGICGPRVEGEIGFSVVRGGGIVGEHSVIFASEDEVISFSHSARDRSLFARGAIRAALFAIKQKPSLYDMQDVLGFKTASAKGAL